VPEPRMVLVRLNTLLLKVPPWAWSEGNDQRPNQSPSSSVDAARRIDSSQLLSNRRPMEKGGHRALFKEQPLLPP
jgi:hypothetical protein